MSVKLLMYWDVKPGMDQEYFEFLVRDWVPGVTKLGIQPIMSWYTVYPQTGTIPQMMTEYIAEDLPTIRTILKSADWLSLESKLLEYVTNYTHKVVRTNGYWQM